MDFKDIVRFGFNEYLAALISALEGLSSDERRFQPSPDSHHIDFTVWHMARVEDDWIQRFAQSRDTVWNRDGWYQRLCMPERDSGFGYTGEQVQTLPAYDMSQMIEYYQVVRAETYHYLDSLTELDLGNAPHPRRPGYTVAQMFGHLMIEEGQHVGQVAYLRGIQRGLNA